MTDPILFPVHSAVQDMSFGPHGRRSLAGLLWDAGGHAKAQQKSLDDDTPYAELWMGATHEKGASTISQPFPTLVQRLGIKDGQPLADFLLADTERSVSSELIRAHGYLKEPVHGGMPFIFKVLSAGQALPLQAHPDVELARKLKQKTTVESDEHTTFDGHHKPEIALAVTPFRGFIGLASPPEIRQRLKEVPEVGELLHDSNLSDKHLSQMLPKLEHADLYQLLVDDTTEEGEHPSDPDREGSWAHKLRAAISRILCAEKQHVKKTIDAVLSRKRGEDKELLALVEELNGQFPGDVGCLLAPIFMNLAKLQPGECIYAPADTIHAWLSGDIIECMPSSVNVTNTAFGPEPSKETIELFAQMLSYESKTLDAYRLHPLRLPSASSGDGVTVDKYSVPFDEFNVLRLYIAAAGNGGSGSARVFTGEGEGNPTLEGVAVLGCVRGRGKVEGFNPGSSTTEEAVSYDVGKGSVLVVGNGTAIGVRAEGEEDLECYVAYWTASEKK